MPHIKTSFSRPSSRLNSNNDIFERDVQIEYNFNSPKSPSAYNIQVENDIGPKTKSTNPFLATSPKKLAIQALESSDGPPLFNKNFSFDSRTHSDNQLSKVPTHVLSLDDYINSDMDEKCYITTVHKHCSNDQCKDCQKFDNEGIDKYNNKEYCDDFTERMDYFNHKQSSFDRYITENVAKLAKRNSLNNMEKPSNIPLSPDLLRSVKDNDPEAEDNDINYLTAEIVRSSMSEVRNDGDKHLSKAEFEDRKLNRERSRSLTAIIVEGLSKRCK